MSLALASRAFRTPLLRSPLPPNTTRRLASTSTKSSVPRQPIYFGRDVYWGKAVKNAGKTGLLYIPIVAAVMFWPAPIAPLFNLSKGVKKMD